MLGPHVVGQRVVVRRLVPGETGPTGGPALTDLLGVCLSWDGESCVVQPEDGPAVSIPIELIVSGKPVPPRPSVRGRVSVRDAELRTAGLWARVATTPLGEWVLRHDPAPVGRPRRRANSCLAMGDPGMPLADAAAAAVAFYARLGRSAYLQVEKGGDVEAGLVELGWRQDVTGEAEFRLASVARARRTLAAPSTQVELAVTGDRVVASIGSGCDPVAEGEAAVDGDWLGIHGLLVDPGRRRRGLATALMAALLEWGAERGAMTAWLHVETTNDAARGLYDGLGFDVHHVCRYYLPAG